MTIDDWLRAALADCDRRALPEVKPLLESLARSTESLRRTDREIRAREEAETTA